MARSFPINFGHRGSTAQVLRALANNQIRDAFRPRLSYRQVVSFGDFVGEGDTDQLLVLNTLFPSNTFPTDVDVLPGTTVENLVLPAGTSWSALTIRVGIAAGDDDAFLTVSNLLGSGAAVGDILQTPAAAVYGGLHYPALSPQVRLVATGGNLSAMTAGRFELVIPFTPRAQRSS
jgi:hypothetical protein